MGPLTLISMFCLTTATCNQYWYSTAASTRQYLGHLVDGGPAAQKWTTTLIFTVPSIDYGATIRVRFYDDTGQPLALDFGQGASTTLDVNVPAAGTKVLTSRGASTTALSGWAIAEAIDNPPTNPATAFTASLLYRAQLVGNQWWDVATAGTGSTFIYSSYGTRDLGVAVANPSSTATIHLQVSAHNSNGTVPAGSPWAIELRPRAHKAWNLWDAPTNLASFTGTIQIVSTDPIPAGFVALSLNFRDPVLSPLPPGELRYPQPFDRRAWDAVVKVRQVGQELVNMGIAFSYSTEVPATINTYLAAIGLAVDTNATIAASYQSADNSIHLSTGLLEALGENDAALAFVIAHMLAHGVMRFVGIPTSGEFANNPELIADSGAGAVLLAGGWDPSGAADFFSRLTYANLQGLPMAATLRNEFSVPSGVAALLQAMWNAIKDGCGNGEALYNACQTARRFWHPSNPTDIP
jgi:hypothetical protein